MPQITVLYAGLLGLLSLYLSFLCGKQRGKAKVSIGDGGDQELIVAMRRHANFVEYVPLALLLIALLELNGVSATAIHSFGAVLLLARIAHAQGMRVDKSPSIGRMIGAGGTLLLTLVLSVWAIATFFL